MASNAKPKHKAMHWEHLAAGVSGGVASTIVLHPLDLIKIRFQVNEGISAPVAAAVKRPQYTGISNAFLTILRNDGVRGLYQGVGPNVWGAGLSWGLYFLFYNALKTELMDRKSVPVLTAGQHMLVASEAGILTLILCNPVWVAKTRLCLQYDMPKPKPGEPVTATTVVYRNMVDALFKIYKYEGVTGLYKGFIPGAFGVSHGALQFMAYEELKKMYNTYRQVPLDTRFNSFEYLSFAAISKMFAACTTYPYQVVRARLQDQHRSYSSLRDCLSQIWRHEGWYGFYKGLFPGLLRVTPACCITFLVYENTSHYLLTRGKVLGDKSS